MGATSHGYTAVRNLLWISGGPGKGKTMLSIFLTEELEKMENAELLFYFCNHQDEERNIAVAVLQTSFVNAVAFSRDGKNRRRSAEARRLYEHGLRCDFLARRQDGGVSMERRDGTSDVALSLLPPFLSCRPFLHPSSCIYRPKIREVGH
jgi:hypothetical protein